MLNKTKTAYLLIDMEQGFVNPAGGHCVKGAAATVPACSKTMQAAREKGMAVVIVKRVYRENGSDVELNRYAGWVAGGRSMTPESTGSNSVEAPAGLEPKEGDIVIFKPRWSAFFQTELDLILRRLGVRTVVLAGTTTPNCIRATCYDAIALDYNVVVLTDCTSSNTDEIQRVNLEDMQRIGAGLMTSNEFMKFNEQTVPDVQAQIRKEEGY